MAESIFQNYLNRLTDLSSKNRSLYLPRLEGFGMIDVKDFDFLDGQPAFELLRKLIAGKKSIQLIPEVDPRMADTNHLSKKLARLTFRDQLTQEETGDQSLYLAWPFVEGKMRNGQLLRAPILLLPIALKILNQHWVMLANDSWQWNPAFLLAYQHSNPGHKLALGLEELIEQFSTDPTEFRTQLSRILLDNFQIQLSSSLFEDHLTPFTNSQISLDQSRFSDGKISLRTYALIGQFAQKGSFLFRDYEELKANHGEETLEDLFQQYFGRVENLPIPREEQLFPVFALDASQENVLIKIRQGKSLVVEGPPGTGKSQLIANLVSDYIARGKRVLVVSQKRAALDVVFERMATAGFGDFLALVHDFRADHKVLFEKIKKQIESIEQYQEQNRGIDSIQLEREISLLSRTISRLTEKFENLRTALFDTQAAGIPIKALYRHADLEKASIQAPSLLLKLNYEESLRFEREFKIFRGYHRMFKGSFWENRIHFEVIEPAEFGMIHKSIKEVETFRISIPDEISREKWVIFSSVLLGSSALSSQILNLQKTLQDLSNPTNSFSLPFQGREVKKLNQIQKWISKADTELSNLSLILFSGQEKLEILNLELETLLLKSKSFFGKISALWNKNKFPLSFQVLAENGLKFNFELLAKLQLEVKAQLRIRQEYLELPKVLAFSLGQFSRENISRQAVQLQKLLDWEKEWRSLSEIHELRDWASLDYDSFIFQLSNLGIWTHDFVNSAPSWKLWLTSQQVLDLLTNGLNQLSLSDEPTLNQTFVELTAFDRFLNNWELDKRELASALEEQFAAQSTEVQISAFRNGWNLAWIGELERRNPSLAEAGSLKLAQEMDVLKNSILEKRKISRHMTLLRLRERGSSNLEFNRLGNRLTYRNLLHQVSKKRLRWSIRKLVEELGSEVFRILPCWLASPETVSALFPLKQNFDLVIFDEASQCPVERGLPAMLRGKQVVVAGDSKQLRPSDFYQVKWESDEEGMEYEAESLLELAGHFFEKHQLTGHYRSADPALIHFSNSHFYKNQLETLPDYQTVKLGNTPFSWDKIEGIWENQINIMEANTVVEKVQFLRKSNAEDSVGIVTGNYFQMELIREKLWRAGIQDGQIKVRNIENVQGDEFDQVILSLGYAANREGKLVTNFGLLGKSGAENRLNVAITRARKMMHVISSIEPEDFRPGQVQNPGLALLREFLGFVKTQAKQRDIPAPALGVKGFELDWSLKNKILGMDSTYSKDIPSAVMDLVKTETRGDQIAILTDDQRFFNASTAKAAVAYHPILLEEKGWKWEWKWSRFWKSDS